MPPPGDRRPIAARQLAPVQALAAWMIRRRMSPNAISVAGMVAGLSAGLCLGLTTYVPGAVRPCWLLAALLIQSRLLANMMDGMVAVGRNIASPVGELYNEVPDRVSDTAILLGLGVAAGSPAWGLAAGIAAIATAYVRCLGKAAGAPSEFGGPMAKQQRMAVATLVALAGLLAPDVLTASILRGVLAAICVLSLLTAGLRLRRIARALGA